MDNIYLRLEEKEEMQEFDLPSSLVSIDHNNFLIADMNNDRLVNVNYDSLKRNVVFKRNFKESLLARPVSMTQLNKKLFVADRDNDTVQVFDKDLNQINLITDKFLKKPTAVSRIMCEGSMYIAILTRGDQNKNIYLSLYDVIGAKKLRMNFNFLNDPQGMISIFNKSLCISDTLNRRGLLIGPNLEVIKTINLSEFAEDKRYLCRVPSLIKDRIFFPDYHTGITIVTDIYLNYIKKIRINLNNLNLLNIRKIFKIDDYFLILGKSNEINSPCILVEDIFSEKKAYQIKYDFNTPVDYIYFGKSIFF